MRAFVEAVYRGVLGRNADDAGAHYSLGRLRDGMTPAQLIYEMMDSEEYEARHFGGAPDEAEPVLGLAPDWEERSRALAAKNMLSRERFEHAWAAIAKMPAFDVIGQQEYCEQHRERFFELVNAVAYLTHEQRCPRILEIGVSAASNLYAELFPEAQLDLLDRPVPEDYVGFNAERAQGIAGCRNYYALDLNEPASLPEDLTDGGGGYDLILFTETLSQLTVNPVELLDKLLGWLSPVGQLYLTTANFFSARYSQALIHGRNPAPFYPAGNGNWDAYHLYRDYSKIELLESVFAAGGETTAFNFSCSGQAGTEQVAEDQRPTLVCLVGRSAQGEQLGSDSERELMLHIGSDKAGSTAIQAHTYGNRDWLVRHGVYVPSSYLGKNNGHAGLLEELDASKLQTLLDELNQKAGRFRRLFLSWEGAQFLGDKELRLLAKYLGHYQVRIIYYLREQADVIQSGVLQNIKSQRVDIDLRQQAIEPSLPDTRDYHATIKRWEKHFPGLECEVVYYDRAVFPDGNVVKDLLSRLGCEDTDDFQFYTQDINISLDVPSALAAQQRLANETDEIARRDYVDALLLNLKNTSAGQKYFLDRQQVTSIRDYYSDSNQQLVDKYGVSSELLDSGRKLWVDGDENFSAETEMLVDSILQAADDIDSYPVLFGGFARDIDLQRYLAEGWEESGRDGAWTRSASCTLRMRPFLQGVLPFHSQYRLRLQGRYQGDGGQAAVLSVNGEIKGQLESGDTRIHIPFNSVPKSTALDVRIELAPGQRFLLKALRLVAIA